MKYIYHIIIFVSFLAVSSIQAQQSGQYSLYMLNPFNYNPAYAGVEESLIITGMIRQQWVDFEGAPSTQIVNVHTPFQLLGGGLGLSFENETLGAQTRTHALFTYSFQREMGNGILSIGASGGFFMHQLDGSKIRTPDGLYEGTSIVHNDGILSNASESINAPTFNAGVYYKGESFEVGLSSLNLTEPLLEGDQISFQSSRSFYFNAAYQFEIGSFLLKPSTFVRTDITELQTDLSLLAEYNESIIGGIGMRGYNATSMDAINILLGFNLSESLTFAYAYDITLSDLQNVSNGSHELMLRYNLGAPLAPGRLPPVIYNPRSL